jgi:hypothetical protein
MQALFHAPLHTLHKGDLLVQLGLERMHLLVLLLLLVVLPSNAVELGVHLGLVAAAGVLAEEGLAAGHTH